MSEGKQTTRFVQRDSRLVIQVHLNVFTAKLSDRIVDKMH